jgi:hypothetical protein
LYSSKNNRILTKESLAISPDIEEDLLTFHNDDSSLISKLKK